MKVISKTGDPKFAEVYVAQVRNDPRAVIEFVDAVDPRFPREEKWVVIVSTQIGCPIGCLMCDSGTYFYGNLTRDEILAQIDYIFSKYEVGSMKYDKHPKLKIQFARMGEPALNPAVLDVLEELPKRYPVRGLMPCITTVAPEGRNSWFDRLIDIKNRLYAGGRFQLQFSVNSTDEEQRGRLMPVKKWGLARIAEYGMRFFKAGNRKVTLNFALTDSAVVNAGILKKLFDPEGFLMKITPVNPTDSAEKNLINTVVSPAMPDMADDLASVLTAQGFETIISIGSSEEIKIGSNCGQTARRMHYGRCDLNKANMERRQAV